MKSDHTELQLFNSAGMLSLHFKMDLLTADPTRPCGYGTLGVHGGEGTVLVGNPGLHSGGRNVPGSQPEYLRLLQGAGLQRHCTVDSPAAGPNYSPNPMTPNWDFRVSYDVWIDPAAFGASGFGKANISYVHASPAKGGSDTIMVSSMPCPPNWDNPYPPTVGGGTPRAAAAAAAPARAALAAAPAAAAAAPAAVAPAAAAPARSIGRPT